MRIQLQTDGISISSAEGPPPLSTSISLKFFQNGTFTKMRFDISIPLWLSVPVSTPTSTTGIAVSPAGRWG